MSNVPPGKNRREWPDLIALLAVLATGTVLVVIGHVPVAGLTTACAALVGLLGAWRHFRN